MSSATTRNVSSRADSPKGRAAPAQTRELRARGKVTMRRLLDAGAQAFATRGFHATRVDDIVKLARTSHGTFYLYFANKEDLFAALAAEVADAMRLHAEDLGPLDAGPAGRAALEGWIAGLSELYQQYGPVIRAWTEAEIGGSEFGRLGADVLAEFTRVVHRRVVEITPPGLDPAVTALTLVAMLERIHYYVLAAQVRVDDDALVPTLARVTHASLFGPSSESMRR
jgi:AcrR family transcriptional regulator